VAFIGAVMVVTLQIRPLRNLNWKRDSPSYRLRGADARPVAELETGDAIRWTQQAKVILTEGFENSEGRGRSFRVEN
jgi:hypothetical protein